MVDPSSRDHDRNCGGRRAPDSTFLLASETEKLAMQNILGRVQKAFNSAFDVDPHTITIDTAPQDVKGWDSMGHVTLASSLEQEFNLVFDVEELMEMENVRLIVKVIESKLAKH
jgi:acyl carrier protein